MFQAIATLLGMLLVMSAGVVFICWVIKKLLGMFSLDLRDEDSKAYDNEDEDFDVVWPRGMTWKCEACGDERPDHIIGVHSKTIHDGHIEITRNVKYCRDRAGCHTKAIKIADEWFEREDR